jgi:hypothetical protein
MKFKFEDYDVKSPEIVQAKLAQLFPKGSRSSELKTVKVTIHCIVTTNLERISL